MIVDEKGGAAMLSYLSRTVISSSKWHGTKKKPGNDRASARRLPGEYSILKYGLL
jgi:hypothetical protein